MRLINSVKTELYRAIVNPLFFIAIFITTALFFVSGYEIISSTVQTKTPMDIHYFFDFIRNVGAFEPMLILCCSLAYTTAFYTDYKTSYFRMLKSRTGENNYIISKVIACFTSGGLSVALGVFLFIAILRTNFPLINEESITFEMTMNRCETSNYSFEYLLYEGKYALYFALNLVQIFFICGFWSVTGILISSIVPNPFVAILGPYLLSYVGGYFIIKMPAYLNTVHLLKGSFNLGSPTINLLYIIGFSVVCTTFLGLIFGYLCKRRFRDELY